ncbi:MAG: MotA/TolQ/ExbB proton channel family protein [Myxococcota bacterium]|nr:MotA/TolQ/ExbB proton channel family protein [Myxococcota bacterium]
MPTQAVCPHCQAESELPAAEAGSAIDCPACDQSFLLPPADSGHGAGLNAVELGTAEPMRLPDAGAQTDSHSRDVSLGSTGLVAAGVTVVFYVAVVMPLGETFFGQLFGARGWVPYAVSYLAAWCGVLLAAKYRRLRRRTRVLDFDLLPRQLSEEITPDNVGAFIDYLSRLPGPFEDDFLFQRVRRCLEHFQSRANAAETVDQLRSHAVRDEDIVESSYTMLRVFIWAIPILGFIGTVLGIGASVGGFSESVSAAANLDVMKDSIGMVTSGLGVAFDTTLLALVMSIFIMVPTSSLQKSEEDYLARVDEYCQRYLVARLADGRTGRADELQWTQAAADQLVEKILEALERRSPGAG